MASGTGSIYDTVALLPDGSATYTVRATVAPSAPDSLVNTATVTLPAWVSDPTPGDHSATVATPVSGTAGGLFFYTVLPCRVVDTREAPGPSGGPALGPNATRTFPVTGGPCGIPPGAKAVSANVIAVRPVAAGHLAVCPGDAASAPLVSTINFSPGQNRANNAVLRLAVDGTGTIKVKNASAGTVDFVLDVNGYFQ
jgi:hypothetical protein